MLVIPSKTRQPSASAQYKTNHLMPDKLYFDSYLILSNKGLYGNFLFWINIFQLNYSNRYCLHLSGINCLLKFSGRSFGNVCAKLSLARSMKNKINMVVKGMLDTMFCLKRKITTVWSIKDNTFGLKKLQYSMLLCTDTAQRWIGLFCHVIFKLRICSIRAK